MRFDLPAQKKLVHEMVIPIRWGDMDAMGHVNNTLYFRYMKVVRLDWIFSRNPAFSMAQEGPRHHQCVLQLPAPAHLPG